MRTTALLLMASLTTACHVENELYSTLCFEPCYTGPEGTEGVGACYSGEPVCEKGVFVECLGEAHPSEEYCDLIDNDCNGIVDDAVMDTGAGDLCGSEVGECSYGSMQCVEGAMSCVGETGPVEEACDALDNDCNGLVDDMGHLGYCYDGDPDDLYYGECHAGILVCDWGVEICENQQLPEEEVCDGRDNDCDGFVDEELSEGENVDIVFVLDRSGSMHTHFSSVASAAGLFAAAFTGVPEFRFALIGIPASDGDAAPEVLLDFTDASTFVAELSLMTTTGGGWEASYDAPYQASTGELGLSWRPADVRKYVVLFTDEQGQSYLDPGITESDVANELLVNDITFYGFIKNIFWHDFDDIASLTGGNLYDLGSSSQMEEDLSEIFSDECWE